MFFSVAYKRVKVRNSYTVQYSDGVGQICNFVVVDGLSYVLVLIYKRLPSSSIGYNALSVSTIARGPIICIPSSVRPRLPADLEYWPFAHRLSTN